MSQCWKCGKELAGGIECEPVCWGNPSDEDDSVEMTVEEYEAKTVAIDWAKVNTLQDLKEVVITLGLIDRVFRDSPEAKTLKRFLKSEPDGQS